MRRKLYPRYLTGLVAALATAVAFVAATPAMATVTGSQINSVTTADGFTSNPVAPLLFSGFDSTAATAEKMTVAGVATTDDANAADAVDVRCYYGNGGSYNTLTSNVAVAADGTFTTTDNASNLADYTCRLAAVPSGDTKPLDQTKFTGPIHGIGYQEDNKKISGGPNDGQRYDFFSDSHMLKGAFELDSSGNCGISETSAINAALYDNFEYYGFADCGAALFTSGNGDDYGRSEIQIDGKDVYNSYGSYSLGGDGNGHNAFNNGNFPALTWTNAVDPLTGVMTTTESEPLVDCGSATFPATAQCAAASNTSQSSFNSTGVKFDRTYKTGADGQRITVTDTYTSTDGQQHALDVEYDNYSYQADAVFRFPGSAGFNYYSSGDTVYLPAQAIGTIYTQDDYYPSSEYESRPSSLTYMTQPDRVFFNYSGDEFVLQYRRTVPAGGALTFTHVYNYATTPQDVAALAAQTEDAAQPPTVAITSPANGASVTAGSVLVSGTAADDHGVSSLTVNGVPTIVGADGTWSQRIDLPTGGQTITAIAKDASGNTSQAQETVNVGVSQCTVPAVVGKKTADAGAALTAAGCKTGAQSAATSKTVPAGSVVSQSVQPGLSGALGLPVDLTISLGRFTGAKVGSKTAKLSGRVVSVVVKCGSSAVTSGRVALKAGKAKLGSAAFTCKAGKKATAHIKVSKAKAKSLKGKKTKGSVSISARNAQGDKATKGGKVTIKG